MTEHDEVETTDDVVERDWQKIKAKNREQAARIKELEVEVERIPELELQARRALLHEMGRNPDLPGGRLLMKALELGEVEADREALDDYAREHGYQLSDTETYAQHAANALADLHQVTYSNVPSEANGIAEAEARGDWETSRALKSGQLARALEER